MENSTLALDFNGTKNSTDINHLNATEEPFILTLHPSIGHFQLYVAPVLLFAGTIGNVIAFVVFSRTRLRSSATSFYFRVLSVVDILVLNVGLWPSWMRDAFDIEMYEVTSANCRIRSYLSYVLPDISTWCLVVMTLERVIGVSFPHKVHSICTRSRVILSVVVMVFVLVLANLPALFIRDVSDGRCTTADGMESIASYVWPSVDLVIYCFLPFVIMMICNAKIISVVCRSQRQTNKDGGAGITWLTFTLLTVTFAFLLLTAPFAIYSIILEYLFDKSMHNVDWWLFYYTASYLRFINTAVNFPLYCMSGKPFRRELVRMFRCVSDREERRRASSVANAIYLSEHSRPSTTSIGIINKSFSNGSK